MLTRNALRAGVVTGILGLTGCAAYPAGYGSSGYSANYYGPSYYGTGGYDVSDYYGSPYYGSADYGGGLLLGGGYGWWGNRDHGRSHGDRDRDRWNRGNGWGANRWQSQPHTAWNGWGSGWRGQQQAGAWHGGSGGPSFFGGNHAAPGGGAHPNANPAGGRSAASTFFGTPNH
jgi:hypothetical protein